MDAAWVKEQITEMVRKNNPNGYFRDPLVGFSSADDPLYAGLHKTVGDYHMLPQQMLPEIKTVISFFIPFSKQVVQANRVSHVDVAKEWVLSYHYCNRLINDICDTLVDTFRANGVAAATVIATGSFDEVRCVSSWSHRTAAYIAGMGSFGLNRMLITEKGCAGRYGTLFVAEEFPPTPRDTVERCAYYAKGTCKFCVENCPVHALEPEGDMHRSVCMARCYLPSEYMQDHAPAECCGKCVMGPCAYQE